MSKDTYILGYQGRGVAVIIAGDETELKDKTIQAIREEVSADEDCQIALSIEDEIHQGVKNSVKTSYVQDGYFFKDDEFTLTKVASY